MEAHNSTVSLGDLIDPPTQDGVTCPKCSKRFTNVIGLRMHDIRKHQPGKGWDTGGNFAKKKGKPWTPEQRANFAKTIRRKLREKVKREAAMSQAGAQMFEAGGKKKIQIVYPDPAVSQFEPEETAIIPTVEYCPHCGEHIKGWRYQS